MILTKGEFNTGYSRALCAFADAAEQELIAERYGLKKHCSSIRGELLWLFVYALNTWDHSDGAINYMTENQMHKILAKVKQHGL